MKYVSKADAHPAASTPMAYLKKREKEKETMLYYSDVRFELDKKRLYKRHHIDKNTQANEEMKKLVDIIEKIAKEHMELHAVYLLGKHDFVTGIPEVDESSVQVVCLCYASHNIAEMVRKMMQNNDYLEGYFLDDIANQVLFHAATQMNQEISDRLEKHSIYLSEQYSPGERGVSLRTQKTLLHLLQSQEGENIPVELNKAYMLSPEKTLLYAYGADADYPKLSVQHNCSRCSHLDCMFRVI